MTKEIKTKKMTVTITKAQQEQARKISKEILGKSNISGLFAYWIDQYGKVELASKKTQ